MSKQQAYTRGFVKRAEQYGLSKEQALGLLKESFFTELGQSADKGLSNIGQGLSNIGQGIGQGISRAYHGVADPVAGAVKQIGQNINQGYHNIVDPVVGGVKQVGQDINKGYHSVADPVVGGVKEVGQDINKGYHSVADPIETWWKGTKTPNDVNLAIARSKMNDALNGNAVNMLPQPGNSMLPRPTPLGSFAPQGAAPGGPFKMSLGGPDNVSLSD